ncbi:unnamed protein product, partial [Ascophyllum nodosum]
LAAVENLAYVKGAKVRLSLRYFFPTFSNALFCCLAKHGYEAQRFASHDRNEIVTSNEYPRVELVESKVTWPEGVQSVYSAYSTSVHGRCFHKPTSNCFVSSTCLLLSCTLIMLYESPVVHKCRSPR